MEPTADYIYTMTSVLRNSSDAFTSDNARFYLLADGKTIYLTAQRISSAESVIEFSCSWEDLVNKIQNAGLMNESKTDIANFLFFMHEVEVPTLGAFIESFIDKYKELYEVA